MIVGFPLHMNVFRAPGVECCTQSSITCTFAEPGLNLKTLEKEKKKKLAKPETLWFADCFSSPAANPPSGELCLLRSVVPSIQHLMALAREMVFISCNKQVPHL